MGMDPVAVAALVLSIISILIWVFTFLFPKNTGNLIEKISKPQEEKVEKQPDKKREENFSVVPNSSETDIKANKSAEAESQFMIDTQKFSQMVQKNLEMLNTRVGVKFSVKPLSSDYSQKKKAPGYVDSVDVTETNTENMLPDDSAENS